MKVLKLARVQEKIMNKYKNAYNILLDEEDLTPNNQKINDTLSELVSILAKPLDEATAEQILSNKDILSIRKGMLEKLSLAETLMEYHYAELFSNNITSVKDFKSFMYWHNYVELTKVEAKKLEELGTQSSSMAFVGAGPLPLSPILLKERLNVTMTCLDIDRKAYELGKTLIESIGSESLSYLLEDGALHHYGPYDVVWVASLVPNKEEVLKRIYDTNPNALVAIRSVDGIHQLLYEAVDATKYDKVDCKEMGRTVADSFIINSTVFYKFAN
jgi:hypothetical protein